MSGYIRREDRLFDPTTGALVGYIDANGNEQVGYPVSGGGNFDATDAGTDYFKAPAAIAVQATLTAGATTTVLVEVKDKTGTVTTAATITADTISQVLSSTVALVGAAYYRVRRSSGTGTVNLLVQG